MLWHIVALLSLPFCIAASSKSAHEQLVDLAAYGNGIIKLDEHSFDLITAPHRNWSSSVQFTAMDNRRRCAPCKEFDPAWTAVAKAWSGLPKEERDQHFFGTLDFDVSYAVFQKLGLVAAPVVHVYPPTEGPRQPANGKTSPYKYDFSHGFEAEPLAQQLSAHTPVPIPYKPPFDWTRWGSVAASIPVIGLTLRFIWPTLQNKWVWAAGSICTSLVMTSGYMFTRIRGAPYAGPNGNWVAPGYQNQFGQEVQVVALIYGVLGASYLMLSLVAPKQTSPSRQRTQIYLWTAVNFIMFSILISLFKMKNRGYPFSLLF